MQTIKLDWMCFIRTHPIPLNVQLAQFHNIPKTVVTADILLLDYCFLNRFKQQRPLKDGWPEAPEINFISYISWSFNQPTNHRQRKQEGMLEVNKNIIYCSNLKLPKYIRSRNVLIKRHVTKRNHNAYHKAYNKIIWFCLCGRSLASCPCCPCCCLWFQPSWLKSPHIDQWQKTYCTWIMLRPVGVWEFLQAFFVAIVCHRALWRGCDEVHYLLDRV